MANNRKIPTKNLSGMRGFIVICVGQIVSVLASSMSGFALTIYIFQKTNSATALGLMSASFVTPFLILTPVAGVLVDRLNRRWMMAVSDMTAGLGTIIILILYASGGLQIWHFYIVNILFGIGNAFQWPAYSAAISTMVPKKQLSRANGLMSLVDAGPGVVAPMLAGALLPVIGLVGILLFDVVTFVFAIGVLFIVYIPQPEKTQEGEASRSNIFKEASYGFQYIFKRPTLIGLQIVLFFGNIFTGLSNTLFAPMVLSRSGNNSLILGSYNTAGAIAALIAGLIMTAWIGFKRKTHGVLIGWGLYFLFGVVLIGIGRNLWVWMPAILLAAITSNAGNTSNQSFWQAKVAPDIQGRVFTARRLIAWCPEPFTPILAGLLADRYLEPAMRSNTGMADAFGWLVGTGPGAGMGLLLVFAGIGGFLVLMAGFLVPAVRNGDALLLDHDTVGKVKEKAAKV